MSSIQPRKQRKAWYNAPLHLRRKQMASHLSEDLLLRYNVRRTPVITGDEVKVLRGDRRGETGRVVSVDTKARKVVVDGITHKKADGTEVALPVDPSNLLITKLNLEDKRRRAKLGAEDQPPAKKAAKKTAAPAEGASPAKKTAKKAAAPAAEAVPAKTPAAQPETEAAPKKAAAPAAEAAPAEKATAEASE